MAEAEALKIRRRDLDHVLRAEGPTSEHAGAAAAVVTSPVAALIALATRTLGY